MRPDLRLSRAGLVSVNGRGAVAARFRGARLACPLCMTEPREREGGGWIGQHPDENTEEVRRSLGGADKRVAEADTQSSGEGAANERVQGRRDEWPEGHRSGTSASDDEVREKGDSEAE
jgi:hypothetical protein